MKKTSEVRFGFIGAGQIALKMPHQERFHNFINHLRGEEELCVTTHQALVVQKILDAMAESNRTGEEVRLA